MDSMDWVRFSRCRRMENGSERKLNAGQSLFIELAWRIPRGVRFQVHGVFHTAIPVVMNWYRQVGKSA